jgi:hypothetical protein
MVAMVPRTVSLQEMPVTGKPTVVHAPNSRGGRAYTEVALELLVGFEADQLIATDDVIGNEGLSNLDVSLSAVAAAPVGETTMVSQFPSTASDPNAIETISLEQAEAEEENGSMGDFSRDFYQVYADDDPDLSLN